MNTSPNTSLPQIQKKCLQLNNQHYLEEINHKIYERNVPSSMIPQPLSFRSTPTKYSLFPVLENSNPEPSKLRDFSLENTFFPGINAPYCGYVNKVNDESYLKNMFFALQSCPQASWVPDSTSELYNTRKMHDSLNISKHHRLFEKDDLGMSNPNPCNITLGRNLFDNNTRMQVKEISKNN